MKLDTGDLEAIAWAKEQYGRYWKRPFSRTLDEHMSQKPVDADPNIWEDLYHCPFVDERWNSYVMNLHRLVQGKQ